jgi:adenylate cyclase
VRNKLPVGYRDLGDQTVKNIPDQVHVYQVQLEGGDARAAPEPRAPSGRRRSVLAVSGAIVLVLGVAIWASWPRLLGVGIDLAGLGPPENPALPDLPSLVVLPFVNMSGDPEQEYFSDGITEDLTNALAGNPTLFVISRNSAFTYKGRAVKIEDVGRELGVRYVLEGSVRKAGQRVRITAQLIDAESGFHRWSRQYDRELDDIFAVQSEISEEILAAVGVEISEAELARIRRKPTDDLTAYDAFARGAARFGRYTREDLVEARRLFQRATELDPEFAAAHALLGATYSAEYGLGWSFDPNLPERAIRLAEQAIELDPSQPSGYVVIASVNMFLPGQSAKALAAADKAIDLAPSFPTPHTFRGLALAGQGKILPALESIRRAVRLDPRMAGSSVVDAILANVYSAAGRTDDAVALWEKAREANPDLVGARLELVDHYSSAGQPDRARAVARELSQKNPELTAELAAGYARRTMGRDEQGAAALVQSLRQAGLP